MSIFDGMNEQQLLNVLSEVHVRLSQLRAMTLADFLAITQDTNYEIVARGAAVAPTLTKRRNNDGEEKIFSTANGYLTWGEERALARALGRLLGGDVQGCIDGLRACGWFWQVAIRPIGSTTHDGWPIIENPHYGVLREILFEGRMHE